MLAICDEKMCAGCMACVDACPANAIQIKEGVDFYRPVIDQNKCIDCGKCERLCQQLHPALAVEPVLWKQGWAVDDAERASSSSGGVASAIARAFASNKGPVCSCVFEGGRFTFSIEGVSGIDRFKGSKYVKSDPRGAYREVHKLLKAGKDVLFIGLPCQVSAMRNYMGNAAEHLYTIDLICHGTPSPQLLELFLREHDLSLQSIESISFRSKTRFQLRKDAISIEDPGVVDRYLISFLAGLSYTENCYHCRYAQTPRVSDLTLGDSWGSTLEDESKEGISLILCQTSKGRELLGLAPLHLEDVDSSNAIAHNGQLREPSRLPKSRARFLEGIELGDSFEKVVQRCLPKKCMRQSIKRALIRLGLKKFGGGYHMTLTRLRDTKSLRTTQENSARAGRDTQE